MRCRAGCYRAIQGCPISSTADHHVGPISWWTSASRKDPLINHEHSRIQYSAASAYLSMHFEDSTY